jgi:Uncharacterized protein conserved in bacteria (DUF2313).
MRYSTDQMKAILKSSEAKQIIDYVSPIYGEAYAALWLFQTIGIELDDLRSWADVPDKLVIPQTEEVKSLVYQAFPQAANWSLPFWESLYQIAPNSKLTITQRQNNLLLKKLQRAPVNPYTMESVVEAASGVPTKVTERISPNTFKIQMIALPTNVNVDKVNTAVNNIKPAHLSYKIEFVQGTETTLYAGMFLSVLKKFTIGQVN